MKACFKPFDHTAFFYWNYTACATFSKYHSRLSSVIPQSFWRVLNIGIWVIWQEMKGKKRSLRKQRLSTKLKQNYFQTKTVAKTLFSGFKLLPYTHSSKKWYMFAGLIYLHTGCQVRARNYRLRLCTAHQQTMAKEKTINAHLFPFPFLNLCCGLECF